MILFSLFVSAVHPPPLPLSLPVIEGVLEITDKTTTGDPTFTSSFNIVMELTNTLSTNNMSLVMGNFCQYICKHQWNYSRWGGGVSRHIQLNITLL